VINPQIQTAINMGMPMKTIDKIIPTIVRTICQMPSLVFPPTRLPRPGKIITLSRRPITGAATPLFFLDEDFFFDLEERLTVFFLVFFFAMNTSFLFLEINPVNPLLFHINMFRCGFL